MSDLIKKIKLEDLVEYDGIWYKKGEGDKCETFIMADLIELIAQTKQQFVKKIEQELEKRQFEEPYTAGINYSIGVIEVFRR